MTAMDSPTEDIEFFKFVHNPILKYHEYQNSCDYRIVKSFICIALYK